MYSGLLAVGAGCAKANLDLNLNWEFCSLGCGLAREILPAVLLFRDDDSRVEEDVFGC